MVVQLSTGTPQEARAFESWFTSLGADYLDGALLCYPEDIGTPGATIVYSGRRSVFDQCEALLTSLGEDIRFVGEKVGSAAALDLAGLSSLYGAYAGAAQASSIGRRPPAMEPNTSPPWSKCCAEPQAHNASPECWQREFGSAG